MPARPRRREFSGGSAEPLCMHLPLPPAFLRLARCGVALAFCAADRVAPQDSNSPPPGAPGQRARRRSIHSPLSPFRHNSRAAPPFSVLLAGPFRAPPGRAAPPFSSLQARPLLSRALLPIHLRAKEGGMSQPARSSFSFVQFVLQRRPLLPQ